MLEDRTLFTLAFPWALLSKKGTVVAESNGCLFPAPPTTEDEASVQHRLNAELGWSRCPAGYAVYVAGLPPFSSGDRLVLYGLKVVGVSTVQGRSEGLSIRLKCEDVERYVRRMLLAFTRTQEGFNDVLRTSVHEIRSINTDIKSASVDILHYMSRDKPDFARIERRSQNIRGLSEILSARTDFLDFLSNPSFATSRRSRIVVFQKFDKAKRSLETRADEKNVRLNIRGSSWGRTDALDVFDVIPYLVIQNAIKYSPSGGAVDIVASDTPAHVDFVIQNLGPKLEADEIELVFHPGFRGKSVVKLGTTGSGIGLHFLKELIETHHGGAVSFRQSGSDRSIHGVEFCTTVMELRFPRLE